MKTNCTIFRMIEICINLHRRIHTLCISTRKETLPITHGSHTTNKGYALFFESCKPITYRTIYFIYYIYKSFLYNAN